MSASSSKISAGQRTARYALISALILLGIWTLRRFIPSLTWSVILGVATWPWYRLWATKFRSRHHDLWAALTFTFFVAIVLIVPLTYALVIAAHEALVFARSASTMTPHLPDWAARLPAGLGDWIQQLWDDRIGEAESVSDAIEPFKASAFRWSRVLGEQVLRRLVTLVFTILIVFFVYRYGEQLARQVRRLWDRLFGISAVPLLEHAVVAIRAAVDGIVLVALAEGAFMYAAYAMAHVSHPVLLGVLTGVFAMIPFAAPVVFVGVGLVLAGNGAVVAAIAVVSFGATMLFIVDHFVRPAIIGNTARLPFLWVLLGILGGVESFGLVGLFIGPALMAGLCSLWRDWTSIHPPETQ